MRCSSEMMWGEIAQTFGESWVRGTICGTEDRCMWSHALGWKNVGTAAVGVGEKALSCTCSPGAETQKIFSLRLEDMGQNSFPRQALRAEPLARSRANQTCGPDRTKAWVQSMFVSRASDDAAAGGGRNERIVALAERSLTRGQLAPAVDQIALLDDEAAVVATEWLRNASARLNVDKATAMLVAQAFDRVAGAK